MTDKELEDIEQEILQHNCKLLFYQFMLETADAQALHRLT